MSAPATYRSKQEVEFWTTRDPIPRVKAVIQHDFDVADEDRDGFITRKEAERAMKQKQQEVRKKMKDWKQKQEKGMTQPQP